MALVIKDRIKEITSVEGLADAPLLGPVSGFQGFSAAGDGNIVPYAIIDATDWEVGLGAYSSGANTVARTTILSSSNANAKVSFAAGTKEIICTYPGDRALMGPGDYGTSGQVLVSQGDSSVPEWQSISVIDDLIVSTATAYSSSKIEAELLTIQNALNTKANTSTQVIAGTGLTGGGTLAANRTLNVSYGTTAGTAAQGNDSRIVNAVPSSRTISAGTGLTGGGNLTANRTLSVTYGTTSGTAAQGNDSRITGAMQKSANLSDLTDASAARVNLGLGNVDNTSDLSKPISTATQNALNTKVTSVAGKGLSTEDYSTAEKNKLAAVGSMANRSVTISTADPSGGADGDVWYQVES